MRNYKHRFKAILLCGERNTIIFHLGTDPTVDDGKNQETTMEGPLREIKQQFELEEYAENGHSAEAVEIAKKEAKLRRKLDLYNAAVMMLLMLISYLGRGNIEL